MVTFNDIRENPEINACIETGNRLLGVLGFTEHYFAHAMKVALGAEGILRPLGYGERTIELAKIAGYMHDLGNCVNRNEHAQSGAIMAFSILRGLGMDPVEVAGIVGAIGNHDEKDGSAINEISAALILSDKSDVRRSRVRNSDTTDFDIHDRVNYAVERSAISIDPDNRLALLEITIDTKICPVMDYFEIFLSRMLMCRKAAEFLGLKFSLDINGVKIL